MYSEWLLSLLYKIHFPAQADVSTEQLWGPCNIIAVGYFGFFFPEVSWEEYETDVQYTVGISTSMLLIYFDGMEHHHKRNFVYGLI